MVLMSYEYLLRKILCRYNNLSYTKVPWILDSTILFHQWMSEGWCLEVSKSHILYIIYLDGYYILKVTWVSLLYHKVLKCRKMSTLSPHNPVVTRCCKSFDTLQVHTYTYSIWNSMRPCGYLTLVTSCCHF